MQSMEYGPWLRSASRQCLYSFRAADGGYILAVTDLHDVFEERLSAAEIEQRGELLDCPFVLGTDQQRAALAVLLASLLASESALFDIYSELAVEVRSNDEVPFRWRFALHQLPPDQATGVFSGMITNLLGVIDSLSDSSQRLAEVIAEKNAVIRGLESANSRKVDYVPPRALEHALASAGTFDPPAVPEPGPGRALELAREHWPASPLAPVLALPAGGGASAGSDADSDATHESTQQDCGSAWAEPLFTTLDGSNSS